MTDMTGEGMEARRGPDDGPGASESDFSFEAGPGDPFGLNDLSSGWKRSRGVSPFAAPPSEADEAFWGLSDPAQPRNTRPPEVGPFAPDSPAAASEESAPARTLDDFDELIATELAALKVQAAAPQPQYVPAYEPEPAYADAGPAPVVGARTHDELPAVLRGAPRSRRMMAWGGGVAAVAVLGLFGAYAGLGGMGGQGGEPILIRADTDPVRIAPENPGGRVIPNQNQAVYERRGGGQQGSPQQQMLITAAEQPIDIDLNEGDSNLPGVMVGVSDFPEMVQFAQAETPPPAETQSPSLQPHRVRTFEVRPDGTLVPRADPAEQPAVTAPLAPPAGEAAPVAPPAGETAPVAPTPPPATQEAAPAPVQSPAPADPAPEPAAAPEAAAAPAPENAFYVQISSQPSEALARESMATLSSRYASAIGGRPLAIQSADIPDRGTFYRVRITAGSREEANQVCQSLQSAGGSCFVTR